MKYRRNPTLMRRLLKYFFVVIALMSMLNIYSLYGFKSFYSNFYTMFKELIDTYTVIIDVNNMYGAIENFAYSGTENSVKYVQEYNGILSQAEQRIETLKKNSTGNSSYYKFKDIGSMITTFDERSSKVVKSISMGTQKIYINQSLGELSRLRGYIDNEIKSMLLGQLFSTYNYYSNFSIKIKNEETLIYSLTALITVLCIIFAFRFSREVSIPIHQLALRLQKVAEGNLNVDQVREKTNDEINVLINSFNFMIIQIKELINKIKEQAKLENKLKEGEIKNLEMSNLLHQSELKFLQSQINPHFLFNTMNTIATLAELEDAHRTKKILESMTSILRYNLKKIDNPVTLREEYDIVSNYIYIQKIRFGDRIKYIMNADESIMDYKVPSMILQPFVENAIIHGLEPKEGKGLLELGIYDRSDKIEIIIKDDGIGIEKEKLQSIFNGEDNSNPEIKGGIGVINVMRRLEIIYKKNVVSIDSQLNAGTEVRIVLNKIYD